MSSFSRNHLQVNTKMRPFVPAGARLRARVTSTCRLPSHTRQLTVSVVCEVPVQAFRETRWGEVWTHSAPLYGKGKGTCSKSNMAQGGCGSTAGMIWLCVSKVGGRKETHSGLRGLNTSLVGSYYNRFRSGLMQRNESLRFNGNVGFRKM